MNERKFKMKKFLSLILVSMCLMSILTGCGSDSIPPKTGTEQNISDTKEITNELSENQPTPTDIDYSLERYNLIRRAYWVNGQREKANTLVCEVDRPLGYIVLFAGNTTVGKFIVDGKVSSLNSFLSPDFVDDHYGSYGSGWTTISTELADVDGSYGENDFGIFFFTPDGKYVEWTGEYLYSDIPFEIDNPVVRIGG